MNGVAKGRVLKSIRDLDLNLLHVFEAVYSTNNISRAAELLDLSQPAMSNALTRLRKQIDDPLFVRSGNGVAPTSKAETLIGPIRDVLKTVSTSMGTSNDFELKTTERKFKMIIADPIEQLLMVKLVEIVGYDSDITFEILPPTAIRIEDALLNGIADLALHLPGGQVANIESEILCPVDLVAIARKEHPRIGKTLNLQQMHAERRAALILDPAKMANAEKLTYWQKHVKAPVAIFSTVSSAAQLVSKTDLITAIPRIYAYQIKDVFDLKIAEIQIPFNSLDFHMTWHRRSSDDPGHKWLRENVRDIVKSAYDEIGARAK